MACATTGIWMMIPTCPALIRKRSAGSVLKKRIISKKMMVLKKIFRKMTMNNKND